jgi:hypothetical protein
VDLPDDDLARQVDLLVFGGRLARARETGGGQPGKKERRREPQ